MISPAERLVLTILASVLSQQSWPLRLNMNWLVLSSTCSRLVALVAAISLHSRGRVVRGPRPLQATAGKLLEQALASAFGNQSLGGKAQHKQHDHAHRHEAHIGGTVEQMQAQRVGFVHA